MKYINYFLYLSLILTIVPISVFYFSLKSKVGKIEQSEIIDKNTAFKPCSSNIYEYYNHDIQYKTERYGLRKIILQPISSLNYPDFSGIINVRFIINCKNEIGYFKISSTNKNYKEVKIKEELQKQIITIIKKLNDWDSKNYDSYYQIQIKIKDGKVEDIF